MELCLESVIPSNTQNNEMRLWDTRITVFISLFFLMLIETIFKFYLAQN